MRSKTTAKKSLCQVPPETPEQKKTKKPKITFDVSDDQVISTIQAIKKSKSSFRSTPSSLSLNKILDICSAEWGVGEDHFKGRIIHTDRLDKLIKTSLLWAHYYFSTEDVSMATEFVGCSNAMGWNCTDLIYYAIQHKDNYSRVLLNIAHACNKATKGRLFILNYIEPKKIEGIHEWDPSGHLNRYQRTKIPVREEAWFESAVAREKHLMACSTEGEQIFWCNIRCLTKNVPSLLQMQNQGYRFYESDSREVKNFQTAHPICDKCFNKNDCDSKKIRNFGGFPYYDFKCFVEPADQPLKIDIELLYSLPSYMLQ